MVLIVKLFYSTFAKDGSDSLCVVSNISLVGPILQTFSFPSLLCLKGGDSFVTHGKVDEADSKLVILTFLHPTVFYSSSAIGSATLTGKGPPRFSRLVFTRIFCEYVSVLQIYNEKAGRDVYDCEQRELSWIDGFALESVLRGKLPCEQSALLAS